MGLFNGEAFDDEGGEAVFLCEEGEDALPLFVFEGAQDDAFCFFLSVHEK